MSREKVQMYKKNLNERIRTVRERSNLNQEEFAKSLDMTTATVNRYEKGHRIPDATFLNQLVNKYNCDPEWLLTGKGEITKEKDLEKNTEDNGYIYIPQVSGEISAGAGLIPDNTIEIKIAFKKDWIQRKGDPQNMSIIRIRGDSMETTLVSGDLALIDHNQNYLDPEGGIYAVAIDHQIMIKRLQLLYPVKKVKIISDNQKYESFLIEPEEIKINGKVIWFGREIEK